MTSRLHRDDGARHLHFNTCSYYRRQRTLGFPDRRDLFLKILEEARRKYQFVLHGCVVMPEHFHRLACFALLALSFCQGSLLGQSYSRVEIGVQGSSLTLFDPISNTDAKGGFGARVTYNVSPLFALDVEGDFFPVATASGQQRGGRAFTLLGGPKATWRWHRIGLFGKVRPGVVNFSNVLRVGPEGEFPGGHVTHFALDLGGGVEINTSRQTFLRIDAGELLIRYDDRVHRFGVPGQFVTSQGVVGNSFLLTAGLSYRLGQLEERPIALENARRWEIGVQFGVLSLGRAEEIEPPPFQSEFVPLNLGDDQGFGGRLTCNFNRWLALEATINYFYTDPNVEDAHRGGKILQGALGPKAGIRTHRYGVFAKVRPGFLSYSAVHDDLFPPFPTNRLTHFALDSGGVLEYYPSPRTILRFDLSHMLVFYRPTPIRAPEGPPFNGNWVEGGFQDNGMQFTIGFGWRF